MQNDSKYWDEAYNPVTGCTPASEGCAHCWAKSFADRGMGMWAGRKFSDIQIHPEKLMQPIKRKKPTVYFCCNMSDLFHVTVSDEYIAAVFVVMAATPRHTYIVCTKRADRMEKWFNWIDTQGFKQTTCMECLGQQCNDNIDENQLDFIENANWPLSNVWIGVTVENQVRADERISYLIRTPAAHRFLSVEPLLERLELSKHLEVPSNPIKLMIIGGESGKDARRCDAEWIRELIKQGQRARTGVFVKQLGSYSTDGDPLLRCSLKNSHGADKTEFPLDIQSARYLPWRI